jgi:hypothetical protein
MTRPDLKATLACGCALVFRQGVEGSPVTVVVHRKAATCTIAGHVGGLPIYDHREALRPSTRHAPPPQADWEES